jgi:exopolysaccharide production protein ExoQ
MPPDLALLLASILVFLAFRADRQRYGAASKALIWPSLWYLVTASHPLGYWIQLWGIPLPGGNGDPTEGSIIDRFFYGVLTVIGLRILSRRGFSWRETLRANPWLTAFVAFMFASVLWSHYPYVSFKRFIKVIGSIVMACVVLTEPDPFAAFCTVLRRCLYIHLPMSIICIKYFRDIGVGFDWSGSSEDWQGIATSKNVLGQVAMLGVLYFTWEVWRHWREYKWKNIHLIYLLLAADVLNGSKSDSSKTSIAVCLFALFIFVRIQSLRSRPEYIRPFVLKVFAGTVALVAVVILHSIVLFSKDSIFGEFITLLGRDITMTGRTFIWHDVYAAAAANPFFGVGFGGFWIGRLANIPWNANMTWVLAQAHSGYADTYLQIGYIGSFLLGAVLFTSLPRLIDSLDDNFDFGCFRIVLFVTIIFVNMTESIYLRGDHHLWFLLMTILWMVPRTNNDVADAANEAAETQADMVREEAIPVWR